VALVHRAGSVVLLTAQFLTLPVHTQFVARSHI
jgi:hypothetical protein